MKVRTSAILFFGLVFSFFGYNVSSFVNGGFIAIFLHLVLYLPLYIVVMGLFFSAYLRLRKKKMKFVDVPLAAIIAPPLFQVLHFLTGVGDCGDVSGRYTVWNHFFGDGRCVTDASFILPVIHTVFLIAILVSVALLVVIIWKKSSKTTDFESSNTDHYRTLPIVIAAAYVLIVLITTYFLYIFPYLGSAMMKDNQKIHYVAPINLLPAVEKEKAFLQDFPYQYDISLPCSHPPKITANKATTVVRQSQAILNENVRWEIRYDKISSDSAECEWQITLPESAHNSLQVERVRYRVSDSGVLMNASVEMDMRRKKVAWIHHQTELASGFSEYPYEIGVTDACIAEPKKYTALDALEIASTEPRFLRSENGMWVATYENLSIPNVPEVCRWVVRLRMDQNTPPPMYSQTSLSLMQIPENDCSVASGAWLLGPWCF